MTARPHLIYPPTGAPLAGHAPAGPHPPPQRDVSAAPVVTYADPAPPAAPAADGAPPRPGILHPRPGILHPRPGILRPRSLGPLLLLLAGLLAALLLAAIHHGGHPAAGAPAGPGHAQPAGPGRPAPLPAHHGSKLGPIHLPNPEGNAPRTVPLETVWIIDKALPPGDLTTFSHEAPADVAYLARHALPGDQLGFAFNPHHLEHVIIHQHGLTSTVAHPAAILVAEPGQPIHLPKATRGHDRAIVVITAHPAPWLKNMPSGLTPPHPTARSRPGQTRTYILRLAPGSGPQADPLSPSITQPQQLTADPRVRGGVARALARAFVDAIGATWPA